MTCATFGAPSGCVCQISCSSSGEYQYSLDRVATSVSWYRRVYRTIRQSVSSPLVELVLRFVQLLHERDWLLIIDSMDFFDIEESGAHKLRAQTWSSPQPSSVLSLHPHLESKPQACFTMVRLLRTDKCRHQNQDTKTKQKKNLSEINSPMTHHYS